MDKKEFMSKIQDLGALIALVLLIIVISIISPQFRTIDNFMSLVRQSSINGFIAFGMTCVILTGGIDLSVGSVLALTTAFCASFIKGGMPVGLAMILALVIGTLFGMVSGTLVTKGRLQPFIATLITMTAFRGITMIFMNGKPISSLGNSALLKFIGKGSVAGIPFPVILSISTLNNPFFVTLSDGATAKAGELGLELITVDAGDDSAKQTSDIEDLISKNISVLIVNPVDSDAVAPAVEDAIAKGIKVIAVDRVVNGVEVDCSIASDNVAGAKMAADYLVELAGEKAKTAELEGVNGASATIDRGQGFHSVADEKLDVVASQTANFNRAEGMTVMENMLQANPDIKCVFAHNDEMALGAIEAIGDKEIIVAGFDATDDAVEAVKEGRMAATVAQQPDLMGATAVETAGKLIKGESVEKTLPVEVSLITKDNAK